MTHAPPDGGASVLTGLAYALGAPVALADLAGQGVAGHEVEELARRGQRVCPVSDDEDGMVATSISLTLERAGLTAGQIDRVLIATESLVITGSKPAHEQRRAKLYGLLARQGLGHAPTTVVTFAGCSSALTLLEMAAHQVSSGAGRHILVLAVDRVLEHSMRVLRPTVSVVGDGAASGVVTTVGDRPGWQLRWLGRRAFLGIAEHDRVTDFAPALVMLGRSLVSLRRNELAALPAPAEKLTLLCNNYGLPTLRMFAATLGMRQDQVFTRNVSRTGHLGCPDPLVNLADFAGTTGDGVLVLANAPADCAISWLTPYQPVPGRQA